MVEIIQDQNVEEFLRFTDNFLYEREPENSLLLGLCHERIGQADKGPIHLFRIVENDETVLASIQTPPYNLVLSHGQDRHIEKFVIALKAKGHVLPGVVGPDWEATFFGEMWSRHMGCTARIGMDQKIYSIGSVIFPQVSGNYAPASIDHLDLIAKWMFEFGQESLPEREKPPIEIAVEIARKSIENGNAYLWSVDGNITSVAHLARPTRNGITVRAVYTPPSLRRRGYASAVVAHISNNALTNGKKFSVLYTDAANPTSNRIYQNIGYRLVAISKHIIFS